jgi:hypothetical protein
MAEPICMVSIDVVLARLDQMQKKFLLPVYATIRSGFMGLFFILLAFNGNLCYSKCWEG